jgi:hypothetical protein
MSYAYTMAAEYKVAEAAVNCICLIISRLDPRRGDSFNSPAQKRGQRARGAAASAIDVGNDGAAFRLKRP